MEERLDASAYVVPNELVAMINVLVEAKVQSQKLCTDDGVRKDLISIIQTAINICGISTLIMMFQDTKPDEDAKHKKVRLF